MIPGANEEVVTLTFDNKDFEAGVAQTLATLEELKSGLDFTNTGGLFGSLDTAGAQADLAGMGAAVDNIANRFGAMGAVAFTVIQDITRSAIDFAQGIGSKILDPIMSGGAARSLAIEQAQFQFRGLGQDVEASMQSALEAVQGTAYGLDAAATVAAQFGASGITAGDEMTGALRGVAGTAALTGSSFEDIGNIFTTVAGQGRLMGTNLFQFSTRGLNVAAALAKQWGVTETQVREMATEGKISFQEFASAMDEAFGEHATSANETFTGALANMRAALSRLGEDFATPRFAALRPVLNALSPVIDNVAAAFIPLVDVWTKFVNVSSRRTVDFLKNLQFGPLVETLKRIGPNITNILRNIRSAISKFIEPIKTAFQNIFPSATPELFDRIADSVQRFTSKLRISKGTADLLRRTFQGLFSIVSIIGSVIRGVLGVFGSLTGSVGESTGGFLEFTAGIGDSLTRLEEFLVDGGRISDFFEALGRAVSRFVDAIRDSAVLNSFINGLSSFASAIGRVIFGADSAGGAVERLQDRFTGTESVFRRFGDGFISGVEAIGEAVRGVFDYISEVFDGLGSSIANSLSEGDFSEVLDVLNVGLLGGLAVLIQRLMDGGLSFNLSTLGFVNATLGRLNTTLAAMAIEIRAGALLKIAQAVGILALSAALLASIDSDDLGRALLAMAGGLSELMATMTLLSQASIITGAGFRLIAIAVTMEILAVALLTMAAAAKVFASMSWNEVAKGLVGIGVSLGLLVVSVGRLSLAAPGMIRAGIGIFAIASALLVMSLAVKSMAKLQWGEMARGLSGVGAALLGLTLAFRALPPNMFSTGAGLLAASIGLIAIAKAVEMIGNMDVEKLATGIAGMAAALLILAVAAYAMSGSVVGSLAIAVMGAGLIILAHAVEAFGKLKLGDLAKGLIGMALALTIVGLAGLLLTPLLPSIALLGLALIPFSIGLGMLGRALKVFGNMSFAELGMGLLAVTAGLALIAGASILLVESVPFIAALGLALLLVGAAFVTFGAGVYLAARALEILVGLGPAAVESVTSILTAIFTIIPTLMTELAQGIVAFLDIIVDAAPSIVRGILTILGDILEGIGTLAPQFGEAMIAMINTGLDIIDQTAPRFIEVGINLITEFLTAIRDNIPVFCELAGQIVRRLAACLVENVQKLTNAAGRLVGGFVGGIRDKIASVVTAGINMGQRLISSIAGAITGIVATGAMAIARFVSGIVNAIGRVISAGRTIVTNIIGGITGAIGRIVSTGASAVGSLVSGIAGAAYRLISSGAELAGNIIQGIVNAIGNGVSTVVNAITDLAGSAIDAAKGALGIDSPSKVFAEIGDQIVAGLAVGVSNNGPAVASVESLGQDLVDSFTRITDEVADKMTDMGAMEPTITPVLDLSVVSAQAKGLGDILGNGSVLASTSTRNAQSVSVASAAADGSAIFADSGPKSVTFEQNIYAPSELSVGDIYRGTKSQINLAKEELANV